MCLFDRKVGAAVVPVDWLEVAFVPAESILVVAVAGRFPAVVAVVEYFLVAVVPAESILIVAVAGRFPAVAAAVE